MMSNPENMGMSSLRYLKDVSLANIATQPSATMQIKSMELLHPPEKETMIEKISSKNEIVFTGSLDLAFSGNP